MLMCKERWTCERGSWNNLVKLRDYRTMGVQTWIHLCFESRAATGAARLLVWKSGSSFVFQAFYQPAVGVSQTNPFFGLFD